MFIKISECLEDVKVVMEEANKTNKYQNNHVLITKNGKKAVLTLMENGEKLLEIDGKRFEKLFSYRNNYVGILDTDNSTLNVVTSVRLHGHTGYSLLDGMVKIPELVAKTQYSCAITDHGVLYGVIEFYKKMKEQHKKAIIGFEAYCQSITGEMDKNHLLLIAKNETGYFNLVKLCSLGQKNLGGKFPQRPQISHEQLEQYSEGVVCLSACAGGEIPRAIVSGNLDLAKQLVSKFKSIFGEDFYLEIQRHDIEDIKNGVSEEDLNKELIALAREFDVKLVATDDAHYLNKEDSEIHEAHLCNQIKKTMSDPTRWKFPGTGYHVHTVEEMEVKFADIPEALINTLEIMDKCDFKFKFGEYKLPYFEKPEGYSDAEYLAKIAWEGFNERFPVGTVENTSTEYRERLQFELDVICNMGYPNYFLIVWDFMKYCRENNIATGPGRGSACGSLVAYSLFITDMNPIPYNLLFERFLNPDRVSMPDIDIDFQHVRREEVIEYCRQKYGASSVSRIITFGTLGAKASILDMARVYDKPVEFSRSITKLIPSTPGMTLTKALAEAPELKTMYDTNAEVKRIMDIAMRVEGLQRNISQHACFDENTLVTTDKGLKPIIEVQVGDKVLTHENRFKPVVDTMETETDTVYTLKTSASAPVEVTGNHPFYIREMSQIYKNHSRVRVWGEAKWKTVEDLNINTDYVGIAINNNAIIPQREDLSLNFNNEDFWWIIGRYLGDGWTENPQYDYKNSQWENKRVIICCSKEDETEKLEIIKKLNNLGMTYWVENSRTTYKIYLNNCNDLYEYLQEMGKYAHGKYLTNDIFNLPVNMIKSLLEGYMSADGSHDEKLDRYTFKTVSKELAIGLMQLVNKAYHRPTTFITIPEATEVIEGRTVKAKEKYQVTFTKDVRKREKSFFENGYLWTRVSSLTKTAKSKKMYNLTVYGDSSYTVHGLIAHNCGTIIAPSDVVNYCPQVYLMNEDTGELEGTAQFTMGELEELGLLKMDFLGLKTMTILQEGVEDINRIHGLNMTIKDIPLNDVKVYEHISKGHTKGMFQLEGAGMTSFMTQLFQDVHNEMNKIKALPLTDDAKEEEYAKLGDQLFERMIAGISLYRPGPMDEIPNYINGMLNPSMRKYDTPELEPILNTTYGVLVYQEQVMQTVRDLAGFSKGQADLIRKSMGKKIMAILDEYKPYFINGSGESVDPKTKKPLNIKGCVANGIAEEIATLIWGKMENFAKYAFNKSHAGGYGVIAIQTAWMSYYYPVIFMKANLNTYITDPKKVKPYLAYCSKTGIEMLTPSVNKSDMLFTVERDSIRFGLKGIKNVGASSKLIMEERNIRGDFKSFQDFTERMIKNQKINTRAIECLIYAGALDEFEGTRRAKISILERLLDVAKADKKVAESGQITMFDLADTFGLSDLKDMKEIKTPNLPEFEKDFMLMKEEECAGFFITEHPLDAYEDFLKEEGVLDIATLTEVVESDEDDIFGEDNAYVGQTVKVAGIVSDLEVKYTKKDGKAFNVFTLKDATGELKAICFPKNKAKNEDKLVEGKKVIVTGAFDCNDFGFQVVIKTMQDLSLEEGEKSITVIGHTNVEQARQQWKELLSFATVNMGDTEITFIVDGNEHVFPKTIKLNWETLNSLQAMFGENNCKLNIA